MDVHHHRPVRRAFGWLIGLGAVVSILVACGGPTPSPTWSGDGLHVVDGTWVLTERPCPSASGDLCAEEVAAAEQALGLDPSAVVRSATADLPTLRSVRSDGQVVVYLQNTTGPVVLAVLDLTGGSRRVVGVSCLGVPEPDGTHGCREDPLPAYRVGASPSP